MSLDAVKILGINITISSKKEILEEIEKRLDGREKSRSKAVTIVTPNPEQIVASQSNKQFRDILNRADVAIPDGIGVVWAYRFFGGKHPLQRIPGVELMEALVGIAAKRSVPVLLMGGRANLAVEALECLQKEYLSLKGVALDAPEFEVKDGELSTLHQDNLEVYIDHVVRTIEQKRIRLVFVALGAPKQEYIIDKLAKRIARFPLPVVCMSVGGSFDIIVGRTPRAPHLLRTLGLEWLWRLVREPWRVSRQGALLTFIWLTVRKRFSNR